MEEGLEKCIAHTQTRRNRKIIIKKINFVLAEGWCIVSYCIMDCAVQRPSPSTNGSGFDLTCPFLKAESENIISKCRIEEHAHQGWNPPEIVV